MYTKIKSLLISLLITTTLLGSTLPTGQWQSHFSYVKGQCLAQSENNIYCVASGSLFSYGKTDNAIETYSKISGLSDVYINDIAYSDDTKTLIICYDNGNIDLMSESGIINIPDLKNKAIYGEKTINKIDIYKNVAYISTALGIIKLNIEKAEISETYKLSNNDANNVNGVAILNNEIYAATDKGLYKASLSSINLQDFSQWSQISAIGTDNLKIIGIITFADHIIIAQAYNNGTYIKAFASSWQSINSVGAFQSFGSSDDYLMIANTTNIRVHDNSLSTLPTIFSYAFSEPDFSEQNDIWINDIIPINQNSFWAADTYSSLIKHEGNETSYNIEPLGPASNTVWNIDITSNILRTSHGEIAADGYWASAPAAISTLKEDTWYYETNKTIIPSGSYFKDILSVATDPLDPDHYYAASWHAGVLEFQDREYLGLINNTNSSQKAAWGTHVFANHLKFDNDNNLWVSNSYVNSQVHRYNAEEGWTAYAINNIDDAKIIGEITFLDNGLKWISTPYWGDGIVVLDDNGTYDDDSDDESKYFSVYASSSSSNEFVSDNVNIIEKDNDGSLWVGTDNGIAIYYSPENAFESSSAPVASRPNIPRNDGTGLGDYLLANETVYDIAVDGGNRKWLATASSGVYLVSSDGQDEIYHFTEENSPLLSNTVRVVEINNETGEVYFGTENGLISYQADATSGSVDFSDLKVYPNPVREDFFGDITITGLVDETTVKITDVSGNLVNETTSNGGTATWNGKNFYGERVGTGVYLLFCSDKNGEQSAMTKVMVVN